MDPRSAGTCGRASAVTPQAGGGVAVTEVTTAGVEVTITVTVTACRSASAAAGVTTTNVGTCGTAATTSRFTRDRAGGTGSGGLTAMARAIRTRRGPRGSGGTTIGTIDDRDEERHDGWIESHTGQSCHAAELTIRTITFPKIQAPTRATRQNNTMKKARPAGMIFTLPSSEQQSEGALRRWQRTSREVPTLDTGR